MHYIIKDKVTKAYWNAVFSDYTHEKQYTTRYESPPDLDSIPGNPEVRKVITCAELQEMAEFYEWE